MSRSGLAVSNLDDPRWVKSTRSNGSGSCVEAATDGGGVLVRDSKDPNGAWLPFTGTSWTAFLGTVKRGTFDL